MSQVLTLELSDKVYAALQQQAEITGLSLSELITISLERQYYLTSPKDQRTEAEKEAARQRFRSYAGAISASMIGSDNENIDDTLASDKRDRKAAFYVSGIDNESIDADLAREYADNHEEAEK